MAALWYGGGPEYDKACKPFTPKVRQAGRGEVAVNSKDDDNNPSSGVVWDDSTVEGVMAQLILCDQLFRNFFRGTQEAVVYDDTTLQHACTLAKTVLSSVSHDNDGGTQQTATPSLDGKVYPAYMAILVGALIHLESIHDHKYSISLLEHAQQITPKSLQPWWEIQMKHICGS
eukprot:scaffold2519_cov168-Amphora_coffeaeformis.AAC.18